MGVIALARQVGLLTLRIRPVGPGTVEEGPAVGDIVNIPELTTLRSQRAAIPLDNRLGIVLFASPTCGLCKTVLVGAERLQHVESDLALTVAVDGDQVGALEYLEEHGFDDGVAAPDVAPLDSGNRPYAVAVSEHSVVLAAGAVNTLDQLEALVDLARQRRDGGGKDWPIEPGDDHGARTPDDLDDGLVRPVGAERNGS